MSDLVRVAWLYWRRPEPVFGGDEIESPCEDGRHTNGPVVPQARVIVVCRPTAAMGWSKKNNRFNFTSQITLQKKPKRWPSRIKR